MHRCHSHTKYVKGAILIEAIIGLFLLLLVLGFVGVTVTNYVQARERLLIDLQQQYLAEEAYEVIRFLRDDDWSLISGLPLNQDRYLSLATSTIAITTTPEETLGFDRSIQFSAVWRDGSGKIVPEGTSGGVNDPQARVLRVEVANAVSTTSVEALVTNLFSQ